MHRRHLLHLPAWTMALPIGAWAAPSAESGPLLTITPAPVPGRPVRPFEFNIASLAELPQSSYSARTPWFPQRRKFSGPLLRQVLRAAGADQGSSLVAKALNNYQVTIPMQDVHQYDVMLAHLLDDRPVAVRDKGPLLLIYPFEQHPELRSAVFYSRCAWQLTAIEVL